MRYYFLFTLNAWCINIYEITAINYFLFITTRLCGCPIVIGLSVHPSVCLSIWVRLFGMYISPLGPILLILHLQSALSWAYPFLVNLVKSCLIFTHRVDMVKRCTSWLKIVGLGSRLYYIRKNVIPTEHIFT